MHIGSSSKCGDEPVTVNKANPTIATTQDPASATVGATLSDKATLSGGFNPTGTITFTLYSDTACTKSGFSAAGRVNGAGAYAPPSGFASQAAGTSEWVARHPRVGQHHAV